MRLDTLVYTGTPTKSWFNRFSVPKKVRRSLYNIPKRDGLWRYPYTLGPVTVSFVSKVVPPLIIDNPPSDSFFKSDTWTQRDEWRTRIIIKFNPKDWHKPHRDKKNFGRTWHYWRIGPLTVIRRSRRRDFDPKTAPVQTYEKFLIFGLVCFYAYLLSPLFG